MADDSRTVPDSAYPKRSFCLGHYLDCYIHHIGTVLMLPPSLYNNRRLRRTYNVDRTPDRNYPLEATFLVEVVLVTLFSCLILHSFTIKSILELPKGCLLVPYSSSGVLYIGLLVLCDDFGRTKPNDGPNDGRISNRSNVMIFAGRNRQLVSRLELQQDQGPIGGTDDPFGG